MALSNVATFVKTPANGVVQIVNADAQNQKTVYTAGVNGSKISGLNIASTDTVARDLQLSLTRSGTSYPLVCLTVQPNSGTAAGTPALNMLNYTYFAGMSVDSDGNPYFLLASGDTLTLSALTTVTAGKALTAVVTAAGDF